MRRLAFCGRYRAEFAAENVSVVLGGDGVAHYAGLQVCGLVWACPVCSAAIRERRSAEINKAGRGHLDGGGGLEFVTLTLPHRAGDRLAELLPIVGKAWTAVTRSRGYRSCAEDAGGVGFVRAVEITDGYNGWHPHLHVLLFTERRLDEDERQEFADALGRAWRSAVVKLGGREPSEEFGSKVVRVGSGVDGLARYLAKVQDGFEKRSMGIAREMTRGDVKQGRRGSRTPFEILTRAVKGDRAARERWLEYERATAGRKCLTWSNGLKARYEVEDLDDDLAASIGPEGTTAVVLTDPQWSIIQTSGWDTLLLDRVERLGGGFDVEEWIKPLYRRLEFEERTARRRLVKAGLLDG